MPTAQFGLSLSSGGVSIQKTVNRTGDHSAGYEIALPAGKDVTAWVKTDADTAACNLPAGHAYSNGTFDVYWTIAGVNYCRYSVPGTISTNALSLDGGSGDAFPATATTGIVVTAVVSVVSGIDGDAISIIGMCPEVADQSATTQAHITMLDSGAAVIAAIKLVANVPQVFDITGGATNVFTGNPITASKASNGSSVNAATLKIISLEDSTP